MKIQKSSKKPIKASLECAEVTGVPCDDCLVAIEHIQSAISALSACATNHPDDAVITDSIANLGVVLLDLKAAK